MAEICLLACSFNKMVLQLQENQERLLEKQRVEARLQNEMLKNIEMQEFPEPFRAGVSSDADQSAFSV